MVVTGIRWQESVKRSKRRMVEVCARHKTKTYLHPIIDWGTDDVWQYIRQEKLPYCKLYDEGWKRIGCIGCPMGGPNQQRRDFERWPKYEAAYLRAFSAAAAANRITKGNEYGSGEDRHMRWVDGQAMMDWWLRKDSGETPLDGGMFD
jgi:phosphoadenosine phosphosulfate reductase